MQTTTGPLTSFSGDVLDVYLSRIYGPYNPVFLKSMPNLEKVVISHTHVKPEGFIDAIIDCINLRESHLARCTQFTEQQMIEMFCCLPNLEIIDATGNRPFLFVIAYIICCSLRNLKVLKIEPKYPMYEHKDWCGLKCKFPHINFGQTIRQLISIGQK